MASRTRPLIGFLHPLSGEESAYNAGDSGSIPGSGRSLEKGMAAHSSFLAWRIPWTEELGGLQSMGLQSQTGVKRPSTHTAIPV